MGLCFSPLFLCLGLAASLRVGGGVPTLALAAALTARTTSNFFALRFRGMTEDLRWYFARVRICCTRNRSLKI